MPAELLAQDVVTLCLLFAEGETSCSLETVTSRLECYQTQHDRHFGITQHDFRMLFWSLLHAYLGPEGRTVLDLDDHWDMDFGAFKHIRLQALIPYILRYRSAHFNDEGESWEEFVLNEPIEDDGADEFSKLLREMSVSRYKTDTVQHQRNTQMLAFFDVTPPPNADQVRAFLQQRQLNKALLWTWSRAGESS